MSEIGGAAFLAGETDPIRVFTRWMDEAKGSEPNDPNAVALATSTPDGRPSVRMVLVKRHDDRVFAFYTNAESQKGEELAVNPRAAMCFHWKSLRRQVRVEGTIVGQTAEEVDEYFHGRSRKSQLGAAASQQSRPLDDRERLETMVKDLAEKFPGEIPRPGYWSGYVLCPERIELWQDGPDRLHDRIVFTREGDSWSGMRLYP